MLELFLSESTHMFIQDIYSMKELNPADHLDRVCVFICFMDPLVHKYIGTHILQPQVPACICWMPATLDASIWILQSNSLTLN